MTRKIILIVGDGNLGKAIYQGLLQNNQVTPILLGREVFEHHTDEFEEIYERRDKIGRIILCVKPYQVQKALEGIRTLQINWQQVMLLSFSSGTTRKFLASQVHAPIESMVTGTTNTNVATKNGVMALCGEAKHKIFFRYLCMNNKSLHAVIDENILSAYVVSIGSVKAFDIAFLKALKKEVYGHYTIPSFFKKIKGDRSVKKYLRAKTSSIKDILHVYTPETFQSTISHLMETVQTDNDFDTEINMVATKGGCTREGLDQLQKLEDFTFGNIRSVIQTVFEKAKTFKKEVEK